MIIGILALQGGVDRHERTFKQLNVETKRVRLPEDLHTIDGLVMPGGESTTMIKLLHSYNLFEPLKSFANEKPVFGTCAGSILMGRESTDFEWETLNLIDVSVARNAYGTQVDSFIDEFTFNGNTVEAMFIRAPKFTSVGNAEVMAEHNGLPVIVRNEHHMMMTCHPELTNELEVHRYFIDTFVKPKRARSVS